MHTSAMGNQELDHVFGEFELMDQILGITTGNRGFFQGF
jgi:hypothetical protein